MGASVTAERAYRPSKGSRAAGPQAPEACSLTRHRLAPEDNLAPLTDVDDHDAALPCANTGDDRADPDSHHPNRPHSTRPAASAPRADPIPEISPKVVPGPLTFIGRPEQASAPPRRRLASRRKEQSRPIGWPPRMKARRLRRRRGWPAA